LLLTKPKGKIAVNANYNIPGQDLEKRERCQIYGYLKFCEKPKNVLVRLEGEKKQVTKNGYVLYPSCRAN